MNFISSNTYASLPDSFYKKTLPERVPNPQLIALNQPLCEFLGLDLNHLSPSDLANAFSGNQLLPGSIPLSTVYAGHQFGHFVPQLGDGRAHLLGERLAKDERYYDIQLKGSGVTPYSRSGDGKSSLGPVLREYIVSEAMHHLGVPTTRALAAVSTGELVYRDSPLPGGVLTRVALSHLRIGHFEYFANKKDLLSLQKLFDYSLARHFPELLLENDPIPRFLESVVRSQSRLIAQWMSLGFIHGVMNTDNSSIPGITIDYGPCAFMDEYNSQKVFSSIDRYGRYAFRKQPEIALWNLSRLAEALVPLSSSPNIVAELEQVLSGFESQFTSEWLLRHTTKLGISSALPEDIELIQRFLTYLQDNKLDFTLSFRKLSELTQLDSPPKMEMMTDRGLEHIFPFTEDFEYFLCRWRNRLKQQAIAPQKITSFMDRHNPQIIPRNHLIEEVIQRGLQGDYSFFHEMLVAIQSPYEPDKTRFSEAPLPAQRVTATFCGT